MKITGTRFVIVPLSLIQPKEGRPLPASTLLTWCWLYNHLNRSTGECYPKAETLAKEAGLSVGAVKTGIRRLKRLGLIEVTRQGPGAASYRLIFDGKEVQMPDQRSTNASTSLGPIQYKNQNSLNKSKVITGKEVQMPVPLSVADVIALYNELFLAVKDPKGKPRKCSARSRTYKSLQARIKERPSRDDWIGLFTRMAKSPWCLGRVPKCPDGMGLENVAGSGFLDKLEAGRYDARTQGVDLANTWREKDRLADVLSVIRVSTRFFLLGRIDAQELNPRTWWDPWREQLVIDLKAEDAIELEGRCIEHCRNLWKKLIREGTGEQRTMGNEDAQNVRQKSRRHEAEELPGGLSEIFK